MNKEIKRRVFLSCMVSGLIAGPCLIRGFYGGGKKLTGLNFGKEYLRYQKLVDVPVQATSGPAQFGLTPNPVVGNRMKYVVFSPSYIQGAASQAVGGEPDAFFAREGFFTTYRTDRNQTILAGGDEVFRMCYPTSTGEWEHQELTLLLENGNLLPAKAKGNTSETPRDAQLVHLLTLRDLPSKELSVGTKWNSNFGRVKPFQNFRTRHEVIGFSEILDRKTVQIQFEGNIANAAAFTGINPGSVGKSGVIHNTHKGNAWFDLETGLLVRQETEVQVENRNMNAPIGQLNVNSKFTVQLFPS